MPLVFRMLFRMFFYLFIAWFQRVYKQVWILHLNLRCKQFMVNFSLWTPMSIAIHTRFFKKPLNYLSCRLMSSTYFKSFSSLDASRLILLNWTYSVNFMLFTSASKFQSNNTGDRRIWHGVYNKAIFFFQIYYNRINETVWSINESIHSIPWSFWTNFNEPYLTLSGQHEGKIHSKYFLPTATLLRFCLITKYSLFLYFLKPFRCFHESKQFSELS